MTDLIRNQKCFDRTLEWNEAGYTGKGIVIWDMEDLSNHGEMTRVRILDAAPEAIVINATHGMVCKSNTIISENVYYEGTKYTADSFIKAKNISILSASKSGTGDKHTGKIDLFGELQRKYNLTLVNSAGNDGSKGVQGGGLPQKLAIYVGACTAFADNFNDIRMCNYSSIGDEFEEVDFSTFVGKWSGTSFSCPYLAGICALLQQRYGKDITEQEIYQYFKMIAKPIDTGHKITENYDSWSGYGIPILPHVDKKLIRMKIGETTYKVDNELRTMDVAPIINLQHTFVPVAFVALALGAKVEWDAKDKSVTITKNGKIVKMWIGNKFYHINGKPYHMEVEPFIRNRRTYVPIAFVAEALGCKVGWVANMHEVMILEG